MGKVTFDESVQFQIDKANAKIERVTLTVAEVATMLGVSPATIYTMVREGEIPHFKVRGKILFNRDVILAWTRGEYQEENEAVNA